MSEVAIRAEGLSKVYRLGHQERYSALRDTLARTLRAPWSLFKREKREEFWALKDVDLEVKHGEVLGLIGRNGAGKTTLLKILSRITRPSKGWADIYGRVGSLLEVGTGFHPELSGRDNIYLSGAILGMSKREIRAKFDEIVTFAELEKFLDTQVKHYSSGMYVRLAFAVAAHLDPEILLVDEVLAVGDIKFQKKCLGKMGEVARAGRTIILVSHQMNQIRRLCSRVVWFETGGIRDGGSADRILSRYEAEMLAPDKDSGELQRSLKQTRFVRWRLPDMPVENSHTLSTLGSFRIEFFAEVARPIRRGQYGIALFSSDRQLIWAWAAQEISLEPGLHLFSHLFSTLPLRPGAYHWQVSIWDENRKLDLWDAVPELNIATEQNQHYLDEWNGLLNVTSEFSFGKVEEAIIDGPLNI
jgi:ABC-type polysaccharide/polyol phosphate transport system ATPase subunit